MQDNTEDTQFTKLEELIYNNATEDEVFMQSEKFQDEYRHRSQTIMYSFAHPEDKIRVHIGSQPTANIIQTERLTLKTNNVGRLMFVYMPCIVSEKSNCFIACNSDDLAGDKTFDNVYVNFAKTGVIPPITTTTAEGVSTTTPGTLNMSTDKSLKLPADMIEFVINGPSSINAILEKNPNVTTTGTAVIKYDYIRGYLDNSLQAGTYGDSNIAFYNAFNKYFQQPNQLQLSQSFSTSTKNGIRQVYYPNEMSDFKLRGPIENEKNQFAIIGYFDTNIPNSMIIVEIIRQLEVIPKIRYANYFETEHNQNRGLMSTKEELINQLKLK